MSYSINFLNALGRNQGLDWAKTDPILIAINKELSIWFLNPILWIRINMLFGWFGHVRSHNWLNYCIYHIWGSNMNGMLPCSYCLSARADWQKTVVSKNEHISDDFNFVDSTKWFWITTRYKLYTAITMVIYQCRMVVKSQWNREFDFG